MGKFPGATVILVAFSTTFPYLGYGFKKAKRYIMTHSGEPMERLTIMLSIFITKLLAGLMTLGFFLRMFPKKLKKKYKYWKQRQNRQKAKLLIKAEECVKAMRPLIKKKIHMDADEAV